VEIQSHLPPPRRAGRPMERHRERLGGRVKQRWFEARGENGAGVIGRQPPLRGCGVGCRCSTAGRGPF
jgi:hypothetical protein